MKRYLLTVETVDSTRPDMYQVDAETISMAHYLATNLIASKYQQSSIEHIQIEEEN